MNRKHWTYPVDKDAHSCVKPAKVYHSANIVLGTLVTKESSERVCTLKWILHVCMMK